MDSVRLAAARTIVPGCGLALVGWKPAAAKPRRVEMFAVILERLTMFVVGDAEAARHGAYSVREVERAQRGSG